MSTRTSAAVARDDMLIMEGSLIGNGGDTPNGSGGMIPSTAPPFAMTRWVAQTRQNFVSMLPYNETDTSIHGFQVRHQKLAIIFVILIHTLQQATHQVRWQMVIGKSYQLISGG